MYRQRRSPSRRISRGVTLIELMVTIAVLVVTLTVGTSWMGYIIANNQRVAAVNTLMGMLNLARSEAIKRATDVTLCAAATDVTASTTEDPCSNAGEWENGYVVYQVVDATLGSETFGIIRIHPGVVGSGLTVRSNGNAITYQDDGSVTADSPATFTFCDTRGVVEGRSITVALSGRPMVKTSATCAD